MAHDANDSIFASVVGPTALATGASGAAGGFALSGPALGLGEVGVDLAALAGAPGGAVAGAGLAGIGLGALAAGAIEEDGTRFHDENGIEMSAFDQAASWGHGARHAVDAWMGEDSATGWALGGAVSGISSIPLAAISGIGGLFDWLAG